MQSETRQKADRGSAPRKWNGTEGGHTKHGWRTNFNLLTAEHSLPHLFSKRRKSIFPKNRQRTIPPEKQAENNFSPKQEEYWFSPKKKENYFFKRERKILFPKRGGRQYTNRKRNRGAIKVLRRQTAAA
jgi:hypothetical protein